MKRKKAEFLKILSSYQGIIHKVNYIYFRNKSDREDNFQEIVYKLWKYYPSLQKKESIGSWIYKISINTSISRIKKLSRIDYHENIIVKTEEKNIYDEFSRNEEIKLLLEAIYQLNTIDKSIMLLYLEEKTYEEISNIMGISKTNVGVRISRAKKILKENLKNIE